MFEMYIFTVYDNVTYFTSWHFNFFRCIYGLFMPLIGQDSGRGDRKALCEEREGIGKGPRAGIRTRVAVSAVALYVGALTARLLAPTKFWSFYREIKNLVYMWHFASDFDFLLTCKGM